MPNFGSAINVNVVADPSTDPGTLTVIGNDGNQIVVDQNVLEQTINWNLQLTDGQSGSFNPLKPGSSSSGFSWTCPTPPKPTTFHDYSEPGANGAQIQVVDANTASSNQGEWTYKLRATVNDRPCETNPPSPKRGDPGDPSIKNR